MKLDVQLDWPATQTVPLHVDSQNLQGKTIIITGANAGLGLESAKLLAKMNPAKIILACRNMETAGKAVETIIADGFNDIEAWHLDQSSFASVKAFTKRFNESGLDLHVLLANAGMVFKNQPTPEFTEDGHEVTLETNHLGAALLTLGLLPAVRRTAAKASGDQLPRIVIVASDVHYWTDFLPAKATGNIIKAMDSADSYLGFAPRYFDTKLLNVFFAQELGKKLQQSKVEEDKKIVVSIVNPGLNLTRAQMEDSNSPIPAFQRSLAREYHEGCKTHVFASIDPSAGKPGEALFYTHCTTAETADITLGKEGDALRERVWRDTLEVLGVTDQDFQL